MGREAIISIGTTATKILDINPKRSEYILNNQSAVTIYLGISKEVSTSGTRQGRALGAGALESANSKDEPKLIREELYGIVATGTATLWVWEA